MAQPSNDPFAQADEAQTASAPRPTAPAKKTPAAPSEDGKIVVTLKAGAGFDAPWIVIHGTSVEDVHQKFSDKRFVELMKRTRDAGLYFSGKTPAKPAEPTKPAAKGQPEGATATPKGTPSVDAETGKVTHSK